MFEMILTRIEAEPVATVLVGYFAESHLQRTNDGGCAGSLGYQAAWTVTVGSYGYLEPLKLALENRTDYRELGGSVQREVDG